MKYLHLRVHQDLILSVIDFYTSKITNPNLFEKIKVFCKNHILLNRIHNHNIFIDLGYLMKDDFLNYATANGIISGVPISEFDQILEALIENRILLKIDPNTFNNTHTLYSTNDNIASFYVKNGIILNKLFGFNYIIDRYLPSVFKIENINDKKIDIGNGFLIKVDSQSLIITNKHVIEGHIKIVVKDYNDNPIEFNRIITDEKNDLAVILIESTNNSTEYFLLNPNLNVLEEILTIGYPPVPTTKASYPLFHLGEINSFVESYWGHSLFIFSAKTNPGNSGSPIIDKNGTILGIVTEQLEEKEWYVNSKLPYYAGIPASEIIRFINESVPL